MEVNGKKKSKKELKVENELRLEELEKKFLEWRENYPKNDTFVKLKMKGESGSFSLFALAVFVMEEDLFRIKRYLGWNYKLQVKLSEEIEKTEHKMEFIDELTSELKKDLNNVVTAKQEVDLIIIEIQGYLFELELFTKFTKQLPKGFENSLQKNKQEFLQITTEIDGPTIPRNWFYYRAKLSVLEKDILGLLNSIE